MGFSSLRHTY